VGCWVSSSPQAIKRPTRSEIGAKVTPPGMTRGEIGPAVVTNAPERGQRARRRISGKRKRSPSSLRHLRHPSHHLRRYRPPVRLGRFNVARTVSIPLPTRATAVRVATSVTSRPPISASRGSARVAAAAPASPAKPAATASAGI
jgi:hypothetical protein